MPGEVSGTPTAARSRTRRKADTLARLRELAEEYVYFQITPHRILAWRESNELGGRQLMRGGEWLD
jgi:hypothetical protein